jgi:CRISPR/Cas system-associated exonuclease Cas4 (RecB family)
MNIEHISVSRKGTWNECQYQYKFRYHDKIPPPGEEPFYFIYGKIVHKIAEEFVSHKAEIPLSTVAESVVTGKIEVEPKVFSPPTSSWPASYKKRMPGHLRSLQHITEQIGFDGEDYLEFEFYYDLDPPNEKFVKGFIDRVIFKNGKYFLIDYKTTKKGRWRKDRTNITSDLQLRTYARVIQKTFNVDADDIKTALYYLEGGNLIGARFSDESLKRAEAELLEAYRQIENTAAEDAWARTGNHCTRCQYNSLCPYYR